AEFTGGTMSGNAGCNTFSGPYSIQGDVIKVDHLLVTEIACQEPIASVEKAYLEALNLADKVAILDNGKLQLWDSASKSTLDFIQAN
ncbi:MAG: META domain-containing protein, partial [Candidatus Limnocylindrales bacterium]